MGREGEESVMLIESLGSDDERFSLAESREAVSQAWDRLPELERDRADAPLPPRSVPASDR